MKLVMLPLLVSAAFIGFEHRAEIADLYLAAYPADPVKREVLEECARSRPNFNRLDTIDRDSCYAGISTRTPIVASPSPGFYDRVGPSQQPGTDIRRQEATESYRRVTQVAAGAPAAPKTAAPRHLSRNTPSQ